MVAVALVRPFGMVNGWQPSSPLKKKPFGGASIISFLSLSGRRRWVKKSREEERDHQNAAWETFTQGTIRDEIYAT